MLLPKYTKFIYTVHMYSGITSGRALDGELLYTKILEVNLFAFAYRLFHRDFSPINGAFCILLVHLTPVSPTPQPLLANVVYKFKCLRDANNIYIGKTIRHLATRVKEYGTSPSAVSYHLSSCETCKSNFSCNNFSIIDSGKNDYEITIKEALHINFKKPAINRQLFTLFTWY